MDGRERKKKEKKTIRRSCWCVVLNESTDGTLIREEITREITREEIKKRLLLFSIISERYIRTHIHIRNAKKIDSGVLGAVFLSFPGFFFFFSPSRF